jgi:hypothetical protein
MGQGVLDLDPLAELRSALGGELPSAQLDQQPLIGVDLHAAPSGAGGALDAQRAAGADLRGELHLAAQRKRHRHPYGTGQLAAVEVQPKGGLGEPGSVTHREGLAEDLQVLVAVADQRAGQGGPVDVQLGQPGVLRGQVGGELVGDAGLGDVGGGDPSRALLLDPPPWLTRLLGEAPEAGRGRRAWRQTAARLHSYRDSYQICDPDRPLGGEPTSNLTQRRAWRAARQAIDRYQRHHRTREQRHQRPQDRDRTSTRTRTQQRDREREAG